MASSFDPARPETVFTYGAPRLKFGVGASAELAHELGEWNASRVLLVTDRGVAATGSPAKIADQLVAAGIESVLFDGSRVEPTDASLAEAIEFGRAHAPYDAIVAIGGGSSIDTAKAVNLLVTNEGDLMDYINAPVGRAKAPAYPLLPLIAIPTTTGTGSESTTICVLDVVSQHVKTGISHARLRPVLAIVDPLLTLTQPAGVTAAAGMDILCHALESYTARPYWSYEAKEAQQRVPYCGANPIADMWSEKAMSLMAHAFTAAVHDGDDLDARTNMAMAATFAGLGFGNAGVHIPHANAYPIAGQVLDFRPDGYDANHAMVPHGMAVALTAPEAFRFTFDAAPERHIRAAELLAPEADRPDDLADFLPNVLIGFMQDVKIPAGIGAIGFNEGNITGLVDGAMKQQRLLATAPKTVTDNDIAAILRASIQLW